MHVNEITVSGAIGRAFDFSQLVQVNKFKCPECDSIIYSRKSRFCGVCGVTLPESFLFSAAESERVKTTISMERSRHREWLSKRDDFGWNLTPLQ